MELNQKVESKEVNLNEKIQDNVEQKKDVKVLAIRTGVRAGAASRVALHID
jgi:hypothetical protein